MSTSAQDGTTPTPNLPSTASPAAESLALPAQAPDRPSLPAAGSDTALGLAFNTSGRSNGGGDDEVPADKDVSDLAEARRIRVALDASCAALEGSGIAVPAELERQRQDAVAAVAAATEKLAETELAALVVDVDGLRRRMDRIRKRTGRAIIRRFNVRFGSNNTLTGRWLAQSGAAAAGAASAPNGDEDAAGRSTAAEHDHTATLLRRGDPADSLGYHTSLTRFKAAQSKRHLASLQSNTRKVGPDVADCIVEDHAQAVATAACKPLAELLTVGGLCEIHAVLCRSQPAAEPGRLRTVGVLAGGRSNCSAGVVRSRLVECLHAARGLVADRTDAEADTATAAAAAVLLGLLDVHPFRDGNGRLSRLVLSRIFSDDGLPFPLVLCASIGQRADFVAAVRAAICDDRSHRGDGGRAMRRLVRGSVTAAWHEFEQRWFGSLGQELQDRAVRDDRETRRLDTCVICRDDEERPNLATLCWYVPRPPARRPPLVSFMDKGEHGGAARINARDCCQSSVEAVGSVGIGLGAFNRCTSLLLTDTGLRSSPSVSAALLCTSTAWPSGLTRVRRPGTRRRARRVAPGYRRSKLLFAALTRTPPPTPPTPPTTTPPPISP